MICCEGTHWLVRPRATRNETSSASSAARIASRDQSSSSLASALTFLTEWGIGSGQTCSAALPGAGTAPNGTPEQHALGLLGLPTVEPGDAAPDTDDRHARTGRPPLAERRRTGLDQSQALRRPTQRRAIG